jgi:hypothetical protein
MEPIRIKAKTITVAGIKLEGYELPDGSYRLSLIQVAKSVSVHHNEIKREFVGGTKRLDELAKTVLRQGSNGGTKRLDGIYLITTEDAVQVWQGGMYEYNGLRVSGLDF